MRLNLMVLTQEEYIINPQFYQHSINRIAESINNAGFSLTDFFAMYPLNSIVLLIENDVIVSYMYAHPYVSSCSTKNWWEIDFIKTHAQHQRKGYGKQLIIFGLKDMVAKGANNISFEIKPQSYSIFEKIAKEYRIKYGYVERYYNFNDLKTSDLVSQNQNNHVM